VTRRNGRWYVSILLDRLAPAPLPATGRAVGLDLGIATFAATSDGELILGLRAGRAAAAAVRRAQRRVTRRQKGSRRRRAAAVVLARRREHEAKVRRDHAHKTARSLIERYDTIAVENLNCRGLGRGMLARDCNDQGWSAFVCLLGEKAEEAARRLVLIDSKHTSQECPECGMIAPKTLGQRTHRCACGYVADRDVAAARVILGRAGPDGAVGRQRWGEESRAVA
jgi:putative transposase